MILILPAHRTAGLISTNDLCWASSLPVNVALFALSEATCLLLLLCCFWKSVLPSYVSSCLAADTACLISCCGNWILRTLEHFAHWVHSNAAFNNFGLFALTLVHCAVKWTPVCLCKPFAVKVLFHCYLPSHFIAAALHCACAVGHFWPSLDSTALFFFVCPVTNYKAVVVECFSAYVYVLWFTHNLVLHFYLLPTYSAWHLSTGTLIALLNRHVRHGLYMSVCSVLDSSLLLSALLPVALVQCLHLHYKFKMSEV